MHQSLREIDDQVAEYGKIFGHKLFVATALKGGSLDVEMRNTETGQSRKRRYCRSSDARGARNMAHECRKQLIEVGIDIVGYERRQKEQARFGRSRDDKPITVQSLAAIGNYMPHAPEPIERQPEPKPADPVVKHEPKPAPEKPAMAEHQNGHVVPLPQTAVVQTKAPQADTHRLEATIPRPKPAPTPEQKEPKRFRYSNTEIFNIATALTAHCRLVDGDAVYEPDWSDARVAKLASDRITAEMVADFRIEHIGRTRDENEEHLRSLDAKAGGNVMTRIVALERELAGQRDKNKQLEARIHTLEELLTSPQAALA